MCHISLSIVDEHYFSALMAEIMLQYIKWNVAIYLIRC